MPAAREKIKLLPCPFCGGKGIYIFDQGMHWNKGIACKKCSMNIYFFKDGTNVAHGFSFGGLEEKAALAERWNQRANIKVKNFTAANKRVTKRRSSTGKKSAS